MIKIILFDADGVLIHAEMFSRQLEREYGIPVSQVDPFFATEFGACLVGEADLKEKITPYLERWGWKGTADELLEFWFKVEHKIDEELVGYIQGLRADSIKCYVATNQEKYRTEYLLKEMGFGESFDGVYSSAQLGVKKPDQKFFERLLDVLGITNKGEVLFWDDKIEAVENAKVVGIHAEVYTGFVDFKEKTAKYLS